MITTIIITIIALITWWRFIQQSLQFYRLRQSTVFVLIGLSVVGVASIINFPHIYQFIYHRTRNNPITDGSALVYIGYALIVGVIISTLVFYRAGRQIHLYQLSIIVLLGVVGIGMPYLGIYPLYYFFIAAGIEEYVKYYLGLGVFKIYGITGSDIILFGMLSGLGFACIENIVYLSSTLGTNDLITANLTRRLIGPIVHMIYSGGLAFGYWYLYRRGWGIRSVVISALVIILMHTGYNTIITHAGRGFIVVVLIIGYIGVSWMIYQCDRLYFEAKNNLKTTS